MSGPFGYPNIGVTQLDFLTSASLSHWMHTTPEKGIFLGDLKAGDPLQWVSYGGWNLEVGPLLKGEWENGRFSHLPQPDRNWRNMELLAFL